VCWMERWRRKEKVEGSGKAREALRGKGGNAAIEIG